MIIIIATIFLSLVIIAAILLLTKQKDALGDIGALDSDKIRDVAREWIGSSASTYVFDGYNLEFLEIEEIKKGEAHELTFSFTSRAAGYGNRTGELAAQVITPHLIEVIIGKGKVISAVTDGVYDEIKNIFIEPETKIIRVYFVEMVDGREQIVEAVREIPFTAAVGRAAIEELLKGPSVEEKAMGFLTLISKGTELLSIDIQDGVAKVDFNRKLQKGITGSVRVTAIRSQIEKTLTQFDSVGKVIITVEGKSEGSLQS